MQTVRKSWRTGKRAPWPPAHFVLSLAADHSSGWTTGTDMKLSCEDGLQWLAGGTSIVAS